MKIKSIEFINDPILGNLNLDFQIDGSPSPIIYIAGENGTGKTAILNAIFRLANISLETIAEGSETSYNIHLSQDEIFLLSKNEYLSTASQDRIGECVKIKFTGNGRKDWNRIKIYLEINGSIKDFPGYIFTQEGSKDILKIIFSEVAINFTPKSISSVTSKNLDETRSSRKTSDNLATEITQLIIDIQALDDADLSKWARENMDQLVNTEVLDRRISRFQKAFSSMLPTKRYKEIRNFAGKKQVIFEDNGKECSISDLSSGEKQIVFRGGFFLKDLGASAGAVALIDEPEISLHPAWQLKIMNFYKSVLGISKTHAMSQAIIATHSPFILQSHDKRSEKIIVLKKSADGSIHPQKEPTFYGWTHEEAIKEAFQLSINAASAPLILVEGETDEKYLNEAILKLGIELKGAEIKWVGRIEERGNVEFTGENALNQTLAFAKSNPSALGRPLILLYDSDTRKIEVNYDRVLVRRLDLKDQNHIKKGIENLLVLPAELQLENFISYNVKTDDYGIESTIRKLDKQKLCDYLVEKSRNGIFNNLFENFLSLFERLAVDIDSLQNNSQ